MTTTFYGIIPAVSDAGFETRSYLSADADRIRGQVEVLGVEDDDPDALAIQWALDALDDGRPGAAAHHLVSVDAERWAEVIEAFEALLDTTIAEAKAWNDTETVYADEAYDRCGSDWTDEEWRHRAEVAWRRNGWPASWRAVDHLGADNDSETLFEALGRGMVAEDDVPDWAADAGLGPVGAFVGGPE